MLSIHLQHRYGAIACSTSQTELSLEGTVLISSAICLLAGRYMTQTLRMHSQQAGYWCTARGTQFGALAQEYEGLHPHSPVLPSLSK